MESYNTLKNHCRQKESSTRTDESVLEWKINNNDNQNNNNNNNHDDRKKRDCVKLLY